MIRIIRLAGGLAGIGVLIVTALVVLASYHARPPSAWIVYTCQGLDRIDEVCRMRADGSSPQQITNSGPGYTRSPRWLPDGKGIIFSFVSRGRTGIYRVQADGTGKQRLVATETLPEWSLSPDGQWIAFVALQNGSSDVYRMRVDGTERQLLTHASAAIGEPQWSRDGQWIVFLSGQPGSQDVFPGRINLIRADGTGETTLTTLSIDRSALSMVQPQWSPDAQWIVFGDLTQNQSIQTWEIYRVSTDGTDRQTLSTLSKGDWSPQWSPDGQWIAFTSDRDGDLEIYRMRADGSAQQRLTASPGYNGDQQWSPDGQWIVFTSNRDRLYSVYRMRADGTRQQRLTHGSPGAWSPQWSPPVRRTAWHPWQLALIGIALVGTGFFPWPRAAQHVEPGILSHRGIKTDR